MLKGAGCSLICLILKNYFLYAGHLWMPLIPSDYSNGLPKADVFVFGNQRKEQRVFSCKHAYTYNAA